MYATISGIYENGQVILQETAPTQNRMKVLIVFVEENNRGSSNHITPLKEDSKRRFSERWQGQFNVDERLDDARLDYLKQRYQL